MKSFKALPFMVYENKNGGLIHFNVSTLALTEVEPTHIKLLDHFQNWNTIEKVLEKYPERENMTLYLDDLIDLEIISPSDVTGVTSEAYDGTSFPTAYRIALTEQCNLACAECFVTKNVNSLATMSTETLDRIIDLSIKNSNNNTLTYHFFGGEPLLRFDLIEKAVHRINKAVSDKQICKPVYAITTNATIVTNKMIDFFIENDFIVGVSVDGNRETHNSLRPFKNGNGSYDNVAKNYGRMAKRGIDCHVLVTPNPEYFDDLVNMVRGILDIFPMKTITINTPFKYDTLEWSIAGKKYAGMLFDIMRIAKNQGICVDSAASPAIAAIASGTKRTTACSITGESFMASVSPMGNISYCAQKWHNELSLDKKPKNILLSDCALCEALGICGGVCSAFSKLSGARLDSNKCDFMHAFLPLMASNLDLFEEQEVDSDDNDS